MSKSSIKELRELTVDELATRRRELKEEALMLLSLIHISEATRPY